jgi:PAS domain S-box-containing protein
MTDVTSIVIEISQWVGGGGVIVGALYTLHRKIVHPMYQWGQTLTRSVEYTMQQVHANGDHPTTLREVMNGLRKDVGLMGEQLNDIQTKAHISDKKIDMVLRNMDTGYIHSEKGFNKYVNATMAHFLGASRDELLGNGWMNFMTPEQIADGEHIWKRAFDNVISSEGAVDMTHKDGHAVPLYIRIEPSGIDDQFLICLQRREPEK